MYLVRQFTPDTYGRLTFLLAQFGFFRLLATFGMGSLVTIQIAKSLHQHDQVELNQNYYSYLFIRLLVITLLVLSTVSLLIFLEDQNYLILSLLLLPASLSDFNLAVLQGDTYHRPVAINLLIQPVSYAIISFVLTYYRPSLHSIYASLIISYILSMIFGILMAIRLGIRTPLKMMIRHHIAKSFSGNLKSSFYIVILQYTFSISSIFILGSLDLYKQSAQLGVLLSLITLPIGLLQVPIASVFQPRFIQLSFDMNSSASSKFLSTFTLFIFRITIIGTLLFCAYPTTIIFFLFGSQYINGFPSLIALSPLMVILCLQYILIISMLALQRPQKAITPLMIQLLLNSISVFWISKYLEGNIIVVSFVQSFFAAICLGILIIQIKPLNNQQWNFSSYLNTFIIACFMVTIPKLILAWCRPENRLWDLAALLTSLIAYILILSKNYQETSLSLTTNIKHQ